MNNNYHAGFRGRPRITIARLALLTLACGLAFGQETTGSITGQVADTSGAAMPNAKVEVTGASLPRPIVTTADSSGVYNVPSLPAGTYVATATATGFSTRRSPPLP